MPRRARHPLLLTVALASACGAESSTVRVIDRVSLDGTYFTRDVELTTLEELGRVRGSAAELRGEAKLNLLNSSQPEDRGTARDDVVQDDRAVSARWVMDGEVVVPSDFDSLAMFSAYAHLERAVLYFDAIGAMPGVEPVPVYYRPSIAFAESFGLPTTDNAAFFPYADGLLLLPMRLLEDIPFPMNPGVLAHEYSHRVFYYEAWNAEMFTVLLRVLDTVPWAQETWNLIRALDEGVADYFGALLADDPRFLSHSVFPSLADPRDLTVEKDIDPAWLAGSQPLAAQGVYDPYAIGAVLAATLWSFKELAGAEATSRAVIGAERALAAQLLFTLGGSFDYSVGEFEAVVIAELPASLRGSLCSRAALSYAAAWSAFGGVCP